MGTGRGRYGACVCHGAAFVAGDATLPSVGTTVKIITITTTTQIIIINHLPTAPSNRPSVVSSKVDILLVIPFYYKEREREREGN
jgi:hypothetical protein